MDNTNANSGNFHKMGSYLTGKYKSLGAILLYAIVNTNISPEKKSKLVALIFLLVVN